MSLLYEHGSSDPRQLLQAYFILATSTIVTLNNLPFLGERLLTYGSRTTSHNTSTETAADHGTRQDGPLKWAWFEKSLDYFASLRVPHRWFLHFYMVSVACSIFWAIQLLFMTSSLTALCKNARSREAISMNQVVLTWSLMAVQGTRRLIESITLAKPSASKMLLIHWMLGLAFYIAMSVAIWIEGADTILQSQSPLQNVRVSSPSVRTMLGVPLFILASGIQHDCHAYLASLPKYTLPDHPIFHSVICPHYTAECVIYLSLALLGAPKGAWINRTVFAALVFVATNLGVTASSTKAWYMTKFGKEKVQYRWRMIPLVY